MAFTQTFTTPAGLSGLTDLSTAFGQKAQQIGAEVANLQVRNLEVATRAGRACMEARDIGAVARVQADYMQDMMAAYADHAGKIAQILWAAGEEAATEVKEAAKGAAEPFRETMSDLRASTALSMPAAKGVGV